MRKGSRLELFPRDAELNDARRLFLSAVWNKLPRDAFDELKAVAQGAPEHDLDKIAAWAIKHGVNAPVVFHAMQGRVDDIRAGAVLLAVVSEGEGQSSAWLHQLATWNRLPVSMYPDDGVASEEMSVPDPSSPGASDIVRAPRERLLEQDHILGPIASDPASETDDQAVARLLHHRQARAQVARRDYNFTPVAPKPDFARHMDWLVKYQIGKVQMDEIAGEAGVAVPAVRTAVQRLAELIKLELREGQRGRPKSRNKSNK